MSDLSDRYRCYIDCLNRRDWAVLENFVDAAVRYNGRALGLSGYREMLEGNYRDIPDLRFEIELLVCEPPRAASRLRFDCTPETRFLGLDIGGRRIVFTENVFYEFTRGKIASVWSIIDKAAIESQL